jgi:cytochrome bd-type quinol oxidase subunit 2
VRRKSQIYFTFLGAAVLLFGLGALLTPLADGDVGLGLLRFIVLCLATACAIGAWGTAVAIVSIHKETWPLYVTVALVVLASAAFAVATYPSAGALG